jgi:UMF1 family MFS transporter
MLINKKTISWALYDFADTAFSALYITFFFPILIKAYLGGSEFQIGVAMSISVIIAAFLVPLIGAISDTSGKRMPFIIGATLATAVITVLTGYSSLFFALFLGFLAHITHLISKDVYDAKMIDIVPRSLFGSLSGLGVGIGYLGTIASLIVGYFLLSHFGWESINGIRAMFWESSIFYIIFALPLIFFVPDKIRPHKITWKKAYKKGLRDVIQVVQTLPKFPVFGRFLAGSFIYNNAQNTVIIFLALYGREVVGLGIKDFFPIYGAMALAAVAGSFLSGKLSDKFRPLRLIKIVLVLWMTVILVLIFSPTYFWFLAMGMLGGALLGAIWTLNRHVVAKISPEEKIGLLFGFEGLTEKFSGFFGPAIFGFLATFYGYTPALVSIILFFLVGLFIIRKL